MSVNVKMQGESHELMDWSNDTGWLALDGTSGCIKYRKIDKLVQIKGVSTGQVIMNTSFKSYTLPAEIATDSATYVLGTPMSSNGLVQVNANGTKLDCATLSGSTSYWGFSMMYFVGGGNQ